ncbi:MAG TPA: tetratricopeptide repeat-containing sensor histidine kinase, partial [Cyclobacteriaceae bacterium]|nr:tetratricopeptide repeat-containing sensor histidine kinase [Cyclobacteriaceae bacterium]
MRGGWLLITLLLLCFAAGAQNLARIDSLKSRFAEASGEQKFEALNDLGFEYRLFAPDSTIYFCRQAYELGKTLQVKKNLSKPLSFIGLAHAYKGEYKAAFEYHQDAIRVAEEQSDSLQLGYCYNNFGRLFFDQGDLTRAYNNFIKSYEIFEHTTEDVGKAYVARSLSNLYKSQGDYGKSLAMSLRAYRLREKIGEPRALISALTELGLVYGELKKKDSANHCFRRADSLAYSIGDYISLAELKTGWAEFLSNNGDIHEADTLAHNAYWMVMNASNYRLLPRVNLLMGQVHYKLQQYDKAMVYLKNLLSMISETNLDLQRDAHFYLSQIYEKDENDAKATFHINRYLILKESLQSVELARKIEKLQFQLEIEKMEGEKELWKANSARNDAIIAQQRLENIILIAVVTFVSALFFVQYRNSKKKREINKKLEQQYAEIQKQKQEIAEQNAKLEKHNHELSDLNHEKDTLMNIVAHDLKSPLNRIHGLSDLVETEGNLSKEQLKYLALIKDSTRSGLDLIVDLLDVNSLEVNRDPQYTSFNLSAFLRDRVNAFRHYASIKEIEIRLVERNTREAFLDPEYLARILDNLISNAIKFSPRNSLVIISAEKTNGFYVIEV